MCLLSHSNVESPSRRPSAALLFTLALVPPATADVGDYDGTVLVVSHDAEFVRRAADSIAEVAGGRLELYKSMSFDKYLVERDERQARIRSTVEAQERERKRMQDFIDRCVWANARGPHTRSPRFSLIVL